MTAGWKEVSELRTLRECKDGVMKPIKATSAILAEEACSRDLRDRHLDHGETETEHAVIGAARLVRLARCTTARYLLVEDLLHKNDGDGETHWN